jgi:hypothetical protein
MVKRLQADPDILTGHALDLRDSKGAAPEGDRACAFT